LICNNVLTTTPDIATVPYPNATVTPGTYPATPDLVLTYLMTNISGYFDIDYKYTTVQLYADAGARSGTGVSLRISFDWTGDGTFERIEFWDFFPTNDLAGYERFYGVGAPNAVNLPEGKLLAGLSTLPAWQNLTNGVVRIEFWQVLNAYGPISIKTDGIDASGHVTLISIPFITSWRPLYQGSGPCGQPAAIVTTGELTTSPLTSGSLTTNKLTTGLTVYRFTSAGGVFTSGSGNVGTSGTDVTGSGTTGANDVCTNYPCNDPSDTICIVPNTGRCVVQNSAPVCVYTNVGDGTQCEVNQPPNLCYTGSCQGGSCTADNGLGECVNSEGSFIEIGIFH